MARHFIIGPFCIRLDRQAEICIEIDRLCSHRREAEEAEAEEESESEALKAPKGNALPAFKRKAKPKLIF